MLEDADDDFNDLSFLSVDISDGGGDNGGAGGNRCDTLLRRTVVGVFPSIGDDSVSSSRWSCSCSYFVGVAFSVVVPDV